MGRPRTTRQSRVRVQVGLVRAEPLPDAAVPLVLVGVVPPGAPLYAERFPFNVVRDTRNGGDEGKVEHLRFLGREDLRGLPSLRDAAPSLMRDAVRLAASAGATYVDVLLARHRSSQAGVFGTDDVVGLLGPSLDLMPGALVVFVDAAGPPAAGPTDPLTEEHRQDLLYRAIKAHAPGLMERYQVGLMDGAGDLARLLGRLPSADVGLCTWVGEPDRLRTHGWRSGAAVAGLLSQPDRVMTRGPEDSPVALGPGRAIRGDRRRLLGLAPDEASMTLSDDPVLQLLVDSDRDEARVVGEDTLRHPVRAWPLAALRTLKILHLRIARAAEPFVFRPVQPLHAFALSMAMQEVLGPLTQAGVLVGPDGKGPPTVSSDLVTDPGAPGLSATIAAQIRPWARSVEIRVGVQSGERANVEVAA